MMLDGLVLFAKRIFQEKIRFVVQNHEGENIVFDYVNENPECPSTDLADFSRKMYYNFLIDDKTGFDPETDWELIYQFFEYGLMKMI